MVPATIVDASTKMHPDGTQMNAMKRNMIPSIGTEQNMTISTLTRMEIMKIFKLNTFTVILDKRSATDTPRKTTNLKHFTLVRTSRKEKRKVMRYHFRARHIEDTIRIEEEGLLPQCNRCGYFTRNGLSAEHHATQECKNFAISRDT